jgi:hypothetical protein
MSEVVEDSGIDNLLDGNVFHILGAVEAKIDRSDFCADGM